jgi:hypothetical protein
MDKLRVICIRNLAKKVHRLLGEPERVDLEVFRRACSFSKGEQISLEEVGCLIGNLAYMGLMKGYIYYGEAKELVVLRRENPFPQIRGALKDTGESIFM